MPFQFVFMRFLQLSMQVVDKGPLISLCRIISVECPTNLNFPLLTSNQNKGSRKQPISMKRGSKFVGHSTDIIWQSKIKGPLKTFHFDLIFSDFWLKSKLYEIRSNEVVSFFLIQTLKCDIVKKYWNNIKY